MKVTVCIECKTKVEYKTNKPKRCPKCREKKEAAFTFKKKTPIRSKKEGQMQKALNNILPEADFIDNGYYSWLPSPKGSPLQLDRYYPELKLAFEFQGRQHYEFNPYMHKDRAAFEYLRKCDAKKKRICKERGITLIAIKYTKTITKDYLIKRLDQAGLTKYIQKRTRFIQ